MTKEQFSDLFILSVRGELARALLSYCRKSETAPTPDQLAMLDSGYEPTTREIGEFCHDIDFQSSLNCYA